LTFETDRFGILEIYFLPVKLYTLTAFTIP